MPAGTASGSTSRAERARSASSSNGCQEERRRQCRPCPPRASTSAEPAFVGRSTASPTTTSRSSSDASSYTPSATDPRRRIASNIVPLGEPVDEGGRRLVQRDAEAGGVALARGAPSGEQDAGAITGAIRVRDGRSPHALTRLHGLKDALLRRGSASVRSGVRGRGGSGWDQGERDPHRRDPRGVGERSDGVRRAPPSPRCRGAPVRPERGRRACSAGRRPAVSGGTAAPPARGAPAPCASVRDHLRDRLDRHGERPHLRDRLDHHGERPHIREPARRSRRARSRSRPARRSRGVSRRSPSRPVPRSAAAR